MPQSPASGKKVLARGLRHRVRAGPLKAGLTRRLSLLSEHLACSHRDISCCPSGGSCPEQGADPSQALGRDRGPEDPHGGPSTTQSNCRWSEERAAPHPETLE